MERRQEQMVVTRTRLGILLSLLGQCLETLIAMNLGDVGFLTLMMSSVLKSHMLSTHPTMHKTGPPRQFSETNKPSQEIWVKGNL